MAVPWSNALPCNAHLRGLADQVADRVSEQLGSPFIEERLMEETARGYEVSRDKLEKALSGAEPILSDLPGEKYTISI